MANTTIEVARTRETSEMGVAVRKATESLGRAVKRLGRAVQDGAVTAATADGLLDAALELSRITNAVARGVVGDVVVEIDEVEAAWLSRALGRSVLAGQYEHSARLGRWYDSEIAHVQVEGAVVETFLYRKALCRRALARLVAA